jgi:uncharacterized protein (DUF488 family)
MSRVDIVTVGHSSLIDWRFHELVWQHGVRLLVDVRRRPSSARHPHFDREQLEAALRHTELEYRWVEALGGHRRRSERTPHTAWDEPAFAGYAEYMESPEFQNAARELLAVAEKTPTAIMCAEKNPLQCHRQLISDWLTIHGARVLHIDALDRRHEHQLTRFLRVEDGRLIYDGGQRGFGF